jgi:cytidylate kinase
MPVITVSGRLASGARDVASALADELHIDYVDQQILHQAAHELGVSVETIAQHDERVRSFAERAASTLRMLMERSAAATDPLSGAGLDIVLSRTYGEAAGLPEDDAAELNLDRYISTLRSVIQSIAARGNVVILGRGSQVILAGHPNVVHVWVIAPKEQRVQRLVEQDGMSPEDAARRIKDSDSSRAAFHHRFFKVDAESADLYDLTVNRGRIAVDTAVRMIALAVKDREAALVQAAHVP